VAAFVAAGEMMFLHALADLGGLSHSGENRLKVDQGVTPLSLKSRRTRRASSHMHQVKEI
jgi:hypothetical protein